VFRIYLNQVRSRARGPRGRSAAYWLTSSDRPIASRWIITGYVDLLVIWYEGTDRTRNRKPIRAN